MTSYSIPAPGEYGAATRDASSMDRPNVRSLKQVHRALPDRWESRCSGAVLDEASAWVLADVPAGLRCQGNGCRQAW